jgi:hypothetical protein
MTLMVVTELILIIFFLIMQRFEWEQKYRLMFVVEMDMRLSPEFEFIENKPRCVYVCEDRDVLKKRRSTKYS